MLLPPSILLCVCLSISKITLKVFKRFFVKPWKIMGATIESMKFAG